ncbi:HEAT repeat domain-containing protein [Paenibacillus flagellatus]|uniref:HEAT repeat domain-containing protein n=1 Tax=Paenibacillus flagellatus TaxID=2211139 RepID=A0A2V5JUN0_9BACL|nr:HEAT repeat domain-containing protein [Paenibacillus flagellatus]PYI50319.1 hypothetical protein DLM86_30075 [Paenibacillus flagellatus]
MSIAILHDLHQEARRLFIAGSGLAAGDMRLGKLLPQLERLGESAPVFKRVADAVRQLHDADREQAPVQLLELGSLLHAILYTQGSADAAGTLEPIGGAAVPGGTTDVPFRRLKPFVDALTERGPGRLEAIRQGYEEKLYRDMRTHVAAAIALEDPFSEIAEFVSSHLLPAIGAPALPILKRQLDLKGGKGDARKLQTIYRLAGAAERELYVQAAKEGSSDVRHAAIGLLGGFPDEEAFLLEQSHDRKKEIRRAALGALAELSTEKAAARLLEALAGKESDLAVEPIRQSGDGRLAGQVLRYADECLGKLGAADTEEAREDAAGRLLAAVQSLDGKRLDGCERLLTRILTDAPLPEKAKETAELRELSAAMLLGMETPSAYAFLHGMRHRGGHRLLPYSFAAAVRTLPPGDVYEAYEPFAANKHRAETRELMRAMRAWTVPEAHASEETDEPEDEGVHTDWDERWVDRLVELDEAELVCRLARRADRKTIAYLTGKVAAAPQLNKAGTVSALLALFRLGSADAPELAMSALEQVPPRQLYYLDREKTQLLSMLPRPYGERLRRYAEGIAYENVKDRLIELADAIESKTDQETGKGAGWIEWLKTKRF